MSNILQRIKDKQFLLFKGDMNPFDGGTPYNDATSTMFDPFNIGYGDAIFGSLDGQGMAGGILGGSGLFAGGGGLFGGQGAGGGKGGGGDSGAYQAQVAAALAQADAAKYTADQQLKLGQAQIDAQERLANQSMIGGIVSGAMAAQKSNIVRKEMLPHEEGAAQIASMDMAMKWNKTMEMRIAGYSDVAINHQLQGKSWKPLFRDAEWNAMNMMKQTKQDVMQNAQLFGFKSDKNPSGLNMPLEEYIGMMSMKDPNELLKVDPQMAQQRNAQYAAWKEQMYASGNDLIVQMFENPQLSGGSILSMKGKEALIDPRLAPLLQQMNAGDTQSESLSSLLRDYDAKNKPKTKTMSDGSVVYTDGTGKAFGTQTANASGPNVNTKVLGPSYQYNEAMEVYQAERQKIIDDYNRKTKQSQESKMKWDDAINALTKGEQNQYTNQINELIKQGVIEKDTGRVNAGALAKMIPPDLLQAPQFSMYRELSDQERAAITDEYNRLAEIQVDPKLVRNEQMGGGVTRKVLLNPDGTRAASVMEGYMMDATGQSHFVSMTGNRTQDFYDRASQISGYSPLSPGYRAPISEDTRAGGLAKRSDDNYMAQYNTGQKGKSASQANASMTKSTVTQGPKPVAPKPAFASSNSNPAAAVGGAPMTAGDD